MSNGECARIDLFDDLNADDKPAPAIYRKTLVTPELSITGMSEYGAQHFCGKLEYNSVHVSIIASNCWTRMLD